MSLQLGGKYLGEHGLHVRHIGRVRSPSDRHLRDELLPEWRGVSGLFRASWGDFESGICSSGRRSGLLRRQCYRWVR